VLGGTRDRDKGKIKRGIGGESSNVRSAPHRPASDTTSRNSKKEARERMDDVGAKKKKKKKKKKKIKKKKKLLTNTKQKGQKSKTFQPK